MKELTTEEKAQRYDKALEKARNWHIDSQLDFKKSLEALFPELKESEDERIRKKLISFFTERAKYTEDSTFNGLSSEEIIAWLNMDIDMDIDMDIAVAKCFEQKPTDKVEPKFKVGDWIVYNDNGCICQIKSIREDDYCLWPLDSDVEGYLEITDIDNKYHLWTIQDAKDGDVLVSQHNQPFIYNGKFDACFVGAYYGLQHETSCFTSIASNTCRWTEHNNIHPATKEQCKLLFQKMKDAGYEWDAEKKKLKKIEQNAWIEEDEEKVDILNAMCDDIIKDCASYSTQCRVFNDIKDWLKSLKDRVQPQPKQEWSEADEYNQTWLIEHLYGIEDSDKEYEIKCRKMADWLKSLRPKSHCSV